ncbi:MAG: DNA polymerase III [Gallionellales bacterium GWA2_55_18]|nr:MAG: DNA polymerase III [Gallionellales bacterium GWA2_55_18]
MDRNEAVLRELNLYPQWVRRNPPAPEVFLAVRPEPVEGHVLVADVVRQAHHERPNEQSGLNNDHANLPVVAPASQADNLGWPELKQQVRDCTACKLRAGCTQTVFGVGDEQADWLVVGEGPGADEDARGEPFVGEAGKLLDNMLLSIKLKRGKNVYIANIVKCHPPGNRTPEADEIAACLPYLQRQIELIKPKLIVALGKTAATALLGRDAALGSLRGTLHDYRGVPLLVTYHPAYLLRSPMEKAKAWQDLCFAVDAMQKL